MRFQIGEMVIVTTGVFKGFAGRIVSIDEENDLLTVELGDAAPSPDDVGGRKCLKITPLNVPANSVERLADQYGA